MGGGTSKYRLVDPSGIAAHHRVARLRRHCDGAGHDGRSIIAGGNPIDAAKYQFMILATIAALTLLADSIIMLMVYKRCFTALDQYQPVNG